MFIYIGTTGNKLGVVQIDDETGNLVRLVETKDPVIDEPAHLPPPATGLFARATASLKSPTTEWIVQHPKLDLLYALTSFLSDAEAVVTTYQIDRRTGKLTKLGACKTGGMQAAFATFSPDASTLAIAHHNDGRLVFFDCSGVLETPSLVLETPEIRPETRSTAFPSCLPSLHHIYYAPNARYLLTVDCSVQSRIWTYPVDERGLPLSDGQPAYKQKVEAIQAHPSAMASIVSSHLVGAPNRPRRAVIHPNGLFVYILFESHSLIQVFEITPQGKIMADCLQEIPSVDPSFFDKSKFRMVGLAMNMAAELIATDKGLWVSNRGVKLAGKAENSLRFLEYQEDGARLASTQVLKSAGPVRHFSYDKGEGTPKIISGMNRQDPGVVETFTLQDEGKFQKTGEAAVGLDVLCVVAVSERPGEA